MRVIALIELFMLVIANLVGAIEPAGFVFYSRYHPSDPPAKDRSLQAGWAFLRLARFQKAGVQCVRSWWNPQLPRAIHM